MNDYINKAVLENDKALMGGNYQHKYMYGGAKVAIAKNNDKRLLNRIVDWNRRAALDLEEIEPVVGIESSIDRYKFQKKFAEFTNQLTALIEDYISGDKWDNSGSLFKKYNDLILYMKNVLKWKNLSETEKNNIKAEFDNIMPQILQLVDISNTEKFVDRPFINKMYENLLNKNYIEIKIPNYEKKLEKKKTQYQIKRLYENDINQLLNTIYDQIDEGLIDYDDKAKELIEEIKDIQKRHKQLLKKIVKENDEDKQKRIERQIDLLNKEASDLYLKMDDLRYKPVSVKKISLNDKQQRIINRIYNRDVYDELERLNQLSMKSKHKNTLTMAEFNRNLRLAEQNYEKMGETKEPEIELLESKEEETKVKKPINYGRIMDEDYDLRGQVMEELNKIQKDKTEEELNDPFILVEDLKKARRIVENRMKEGKGKMGKKATTRNIGKGKITKSMIKRPSQPLYNTIEQENTDKIYGYGKYIANATRKPTNFNPYDIKVPMPINFFDQFNKIINDSKKK